MKRYLATFCIIFWAGLIGGISFLEAPLKFQAPGITIPPGLGIGQLVFQVLNKIEIILCAIILIASFNLKLKNSRGFILAIVVIILAVDTFWLLPLLDKRVLMVLVGNPPDKSYHHIFYIALESIKFLSLVALGYLNLKDLHHENRY